MRRKTQIVLAITLMVFVLVATFSYIYISELLRQRITSAYETAALLSQQLAYATYNAQPDLESTRVDTNNPAAVSAAVADYLGQDVDLDNMMKSVVGNWPLVLDAAIVDSRARSPRTDFPNIGQRVRGPARDYRGGGCGQRRVWPCLIEDRAPGSADA